MNNKFLHNTALFALFALFAVGCSSENSKSSTAEQLYPVRPGSAEWASFKTHDEMIAATQLPDSTLRAMSTEQLLEACLAYPLLGDILAYNSMQEGVDRAVRQFDGLGELFSRSDAGSVALAKSVSLHPEDMAAQPSSEDTPKRVMDLALFEILLAQPEVMNTMTADERRQLLAESMRKLRVKLEASNTEVFGAMSLDASALVTARTLAILATPSFTQEVEQHANLAGFLGGSQPLDDTVLSLILDHGSRAVFTE